MKKTIKTIFLVATMIVIMTAILCFEAGALAIEFTVSDDDTVSIIGYSGEATTLAIPEKIDGKVVTAISNYAFDDEALTGVIIPDTVTSIGEQAFSCCYNLKEVKLGSGVKSIEKYAFWDCYNIEKVYAKDIVSWLNIKFESSSANPLGSDVDFYIDNKLATDIVIPQGVTSIGAYAFDDCDTFTAVTIPDSVISIGDYAFADCNGLESIVVPDSVINMDTCVFVNCQNLTSAKIGNGVTIMGESVLSCCPKLKNVIIGNSVTKISKGAFIGCSSLKSITIPDSVINIEPYSINFEDDDMLVYCNKNSYAAGYIIQNNGRCVYLDGTDEESILSGKVGKLKWNLDKRTGVLQITGSGSMFDFSDVDSPWEEYKEYITTLELSEGLTNISCYAFSSCCRLSAVTIPAGVKSIAEGAFYGCTDLEKVIVSDSVTTIGDSAFGGCINLKYITLSKNITDIGTYAFSGCEKLVEIRIPDKLTSIEEGLFFKCYSLKNVTIADSVTGIGCSAFRACSSLTSIKIPDSVQEIGTQAFFDCDKLESVSIGSGVTIIYPEAFERCRKLNSVTIGENVYYIGQGTFRDCSALKSIVIGSRVSTIDRYAFEYCNSLESLTFKINDKNESKISYVPNLYYTKITELVLPASVKSVDYGVLPETIETITVYNPSCCFDEACGLDYSSTIYGFKGSTAEAFADEIGAEFIDVETVHNHSYKTVEDVKATCKAEGRLLKRCTCGKEELTVRKKLAHTYTSKTTKAATCVATGTKVYTCICGYSYTETLAKKAHSYSSSYTVDKNATCSAAGSKSRHCTTKGCTAKTSITVIAKKSHTYKTTTTKATISKNGKTVTKCSTCGNVSKTVTVYYPKTIKLSDTAYIYNGKAKTPSVTVKDSKGNALKKDTDYTVKHAFGRKDVGKYSVSVTFKGKYTGTKKLYFTINPANVSVKSISTNGANFTLKWKKQTSQTTGYQIQYSIYSSFEKAQTVTLSKNSLASYTVKELKNKTKYYVRMRRYKTVNDKKYYSAWSSAKTIQTKSSVRVEIAQSATIYKGAAKTLSAKTYPAKVTVKWKSSNTSVAKVSSKGKITAVKKGTAVITAQFKYKGKTYKDTCKVTVKTPSLTLSKASVTLTKGSSVTLKTTVAPASVTVKWKSSNASVARVSSGGKITAVKKGKANITAYFTYAGKTYSKVCKVNVVLNPAKDYVDIAARTLILLQGKVKNPSTLKVNNIYLCEDDHVVIWYSAANSYGGMVDGWVCAYFNEEDSQVYKFDNCYQIKVTGGYLEVLMGYPRINNWIDTIDVNEVYAKVKEIGKISYR